jgi:predicted O-methyltransferase YrrM
VTPASIISPDLVNELVETARAAPPGDLVEVGVYQGGSAAALGGVAREQGRRLFLFDTFSGIPHADPERDHHKVGDFADTSLDSVRAAIPDAICMPGVFPDTLTPDVGPIALAHVDCDQYASVRACCIALGPLMVPGGVMVFDDYDALQGARVAVDEVFGGRVQMSAKGKARVVFP